MTPPPGEFPPETEEDTAYADFQRRYWNDPQAFVRDCFFWKPGEGPTSYQGNILDKLREHHRLSVRGPHGLGKTTLAAWVVWWYALTRDGRDWKIVTTASVWPQLKYYLWPEIHKWFRRLRWDVIGRAPIIEQRELFGFTLRLRTGVASAMSPKKDKSKKDGTKEEAATIEGAHADHLMYLFDESKAITDAVFNSAEGAFSTKTEGYAIAISTPGDAKGRFWAIQTRQPGFEDWHVVHVTKDQCISAGQMSELWASQRAVQWGIQSAIYINRVLGDFATEVESAGVIPRTWVKAARARWKIFDQVRDTWAHKIDLCGVDIGSFPDKTVIAPRFANIIDTLDILPATLDAMEIARQIVDRARPRNRTVRIDIVGLGAGVYDAVRRMHPKVEPYDGRESVKYKKDATGTLSFAQMRSYAYWNLRDMLNPNSPHNVALPDDDELEEELCAHVYSQNASGLYQIIDKKAIARKLGRSPDRADAVVMAMLPRTVAAPNVPGRRPTVPT